MSSQLDICKKHLEAEDRQDVEATVATFTDDCYYLMPAFGVHCRGKDEIREHYTNAFRAYPDFKNTWMRWHEADGYVFLEVEYEGTHTQPGPWPGMEPTGKHIKQRTLAVFPIAEDGLLIAEIVYIDALDMLHQLGMLPTRDPVELGHQFRALQNKIAAIADPAS